MSNARNQRLEQLDWWDGARVASARALVVGAGALGNEVVKTLALFGWGHITLVDFDHVESSNLSRSVFFRSAHVGTPKATVLAAAAAELNPECAVRAILGDIRRDVGAGLVASCDVVFGCVDNVSARLAISQLTGIAGRLFVDGGLTPWEGTVTLYHPSTGACYACSLDAEDFRDLNLRRSCPAYAAAARNAAGVPTTASVASIIGASMVQQALKWIHGMDQPPHFELSTQLRYDTRFDRFWKLKLLSKPECPFHPMPTIGVTTGISRGSDPWEQILNTWRQRMEQPQLTLLLPFTLLTQWECASCGDTGEEVRLADPEAPVRCLSCDSASVPSYTNQITGEEQWLQQSPWEMGVPALSWITALDPLCRTELFELGTDKVGDPE